MARHVVIIGAGAAGLMAADHLSALRPDLSIALYDAMPSPARKILMAGKSGLNLTHAEGLDDLSLFSSRYGKAQSWIQPMLEAFGPKALIEWVEGLGQETFIGSSGRVFPKIFKASPLLRALIQRLETRGIHLHSRHRWQGWAENGSLLFATPEGEVSVACDACLLALGGPSWPRLGTDGAALALLEAKGVQTHPFRPANCGFDVDWSEDFTAHHAGAPIKSVRLNHGSKAIQGDFVISQHGIEGSAVYGLSASLRDVCERDGSATLSIDLRPHQNLEALIAKLSRPRGKQSMSNMLRKGLNLKGAQAALLKECTPRAVYSDATQLARAIKALEIPILRPRPLDEAISCAGGVLLPELNENLMMTRLPGLFLAGEMLDWEAPTGGYLLTGCFSQGYRAAKGIADYLGQ